MLRTVNDGEDRYPWKRLIYYSIYHIDDAAGVPDVQDEDLRALARVENAPAVRAAGAMVEKEKGFRHPTIWSVSTKEEFRRIGLQKRLFSHMLAELRAAGYKYVRLYVRPDNEAAIALYKGLGFKFSPRPYDLCGDRRMTMRLQ